MMSQVCGRPKVELLMGITDPTKYIAEMEDE